MDSKSPIFIPELFIPSNPNLYDELTDEQKHILKQESQMTSKASTNSIVRQFVEAYDPKYDKLRYGDTAEWHIYDQLRKLSSSFSKKRDIRGCNILIHDDFIVLHDVLSIQCTTSL